MNTQKDPSPGVLETESHPAAATTNHPSRRSFLGMGAALATGAILGKVPMASAQDAPQHPIPDLPKTQAGNRVLQSYSIRVGDATIEALVPIPPHTTNGDESRYPDKSGTYSKGLLQNGIGIVNPHAFHSFKTALNSGRPSDFENITMGGPRTLNGPQGGLAFSLEGTDSVQFGNAPSTNNQVNQVVVPPPPALASPAYGTELVELYWASLLRDCAFTDYPVNPLAIQAAAELNSMPAYAGPRDGNGQVTADNLFRGPYPGETIGPYASQFFITPTVLGAQPIGNQLITYVQDSDFMTDPTTFLQVQNGIPTGISTQSDPQPRYIHNGRGGASLTRIDVLYQEYLTAMLVLGTRGAPFNPGNPYAHSRTQNGFDTFGGPDMAAILGKVANDALHAVWYQKWYVHLRHRPESGGAIVRQILTGQGGTLEGHVNHNVLNSQAVAASFRKYGDYFLSQAFPEGSPTHPAYPTGHGCVAGACITVLKFFFDGNWHIPNPLVASNDGLSLAPYTGGDAGQITVNGELHKLAHNVSFAHGIHAGIHWRSDTDASIQLGEAVALSILQDIASTYNEKFTIHLTKIDGTIATISNR